jgi:hypothetical protein
MTPIALTIAGSDPSGGAGIQADLKTFHQRNAYGMSVLTLLTVQNTRSVDAVGWRRAHGGMWWPRLPCIRKTTQTWTNCVPGLPR